MGRTDHLTPPPLRKLLRKGRNHVKWEAAHAWRQLIGIYAVGYPNGALRKDAELCVTITYTNGVIDYAVPGGWLQGALHCREGRDDEWMLLQEDYFNIGYEVHFKLATRSQVVFKLRALDFL